MTDDEGRTYGLDLWTDRFDRPEYVYGRSPNAFLAEASSRIVLGGRVLCVADGEGRNSVWLASRGFDVHAVEGATPAVAKAQALAAQEDVAPRFEVADLSNWSWPEAEYDAVAAIFIQFAGPPLRDAIFKGMAQALKPGGLLILEGFAKEQRAFGTGGPKAIGNLYDVDLLRGAFSTLDIHVLETREAVLDEGNGHRGRSALIDLIARKPGPQTP